MGTPLNKNIADNDSQAEWKIDQLIFSNWDATDVRIRFRLEIMKKYKCSFTLIPLIDSR